MLFAVERTIDKVCFQDVSHKLAFLKNMMRAAAAGFVSDYLQHYMDHVPLTTTAKAVWTLSVSLAETLLECSELARSLCKYLRIGCLLAIAIFLSKQIHNARRLM